METPIDMKYRDWEIPFLDILIKRDNVGTWLEFHHKLIDTQRIITQSIPFGMENNSKGYWKKSEYKKHLKC